MCSATKPLSHQLSHQLGDQLSGYLSGYLSGQLQARSVRKTVSVPRLRLSSLDGCAEHHGAFACVYIDSPDRPSSSWVDHHA